MAMISYRPRDPRRGGWGTLLDRSESDPSRPQGSADSSPGEPSEADSSWPTSSIDLLLAEFTSRWEEGDEPSLEEYLALLNPPSAADATALIYQAYCLSERSG